MEEKRTKEVLDFLLSAYRARLAIQDTSDGCPFDFDAYMKTWQNLATSWDVLKSTMEVNLEPLLKEGLLDSIVPYLTPSFEVPTGSSGASTQETNNNNAYSAWFAESNKFLGSIGDLNIVNSNGGQHKSKERRKSRDTLNDSEDGDIIIHVCDESKGIREDFLCKQSILTQEMGYFTKVTVKGQRLRDMDISVHCDISVFDWLMTWVQHHTNQSTLIPKLEPTNVVGLVVSADFLQMSSLVTECLQYLYDNIESVITTSPNLGCLSEQLTSQLADYFSNVELEKRIFPVDKNDRILTRLYQQFILKLNDIEPDMSRGHYASTCTMFKCELCEQYLTNDFAPKSPCSSMRFDCRGRIFACHSKDRNWSLPSHIKELKKELKSWRKVYWRLWGSVHFFYCCHCQLYFAAKNIATCRYHKEEWKHVAMATVNSSRDTTRVILQQETKSYRRASGDELERLQPSSHLGTHADAHTVGDPGNNLAYGKYPCCNQPAYYFTPLPRINGCQIRDHMIDNMSDEDPNISTTFLLREIIEDPTPWKPRLDWGGLLQVTAQKPITNANTVLAESKGTIMCKLSRELTHTNDVDSNDSDSDPSSTPDQSGVKNSGRLQHLDGPGDGGRMWESWLWNNDLTTRYNQDMQREREEKLMMDLACLLSQRVPLDSSVGFHASKYGFLSRRIAKENIGGTYVKIDQSWREQHQLAMTKGHKNKMHRSSRPE